MKTYVMKPNEYQDKGLTYAYVIDKMGEMFQTQEWLRYIEEPLESIDFIELEEYLNHLEEQEPLKINFAITQVICRIIKHRRSLYE